MPASPAPACVCTRRSCRRTCFRAAWLRRRRAAASGRGGGKLARPAGCLGRGLELGAAWPIGHGRSPAGQSWLLQAVDSRPRDMQQTIRRATASQRRRHCCDDQGWTVFEIPSTPLTTRLLLAVGSEMCGRGSTGDCCNQQGSAERSRSSSPGRQARGLQAAPWRRDLAAPPRSAGKLGNKPRRSKDGDGRLANGSLAAAFAEN